jgi:hypothetical protein
MITNEYEALTPEAEIPRLLAQRDGENCDCDPCAYVRRLAKELQ